MVERHVGTVRRIPGKRLKEVSLRKNRDDILSGYLYKYLFRFRTPVNRKS